MKNKVGKDFWFDLINKNVRFLKPILDFDAMNFINSVFNRTSKSQKMKAKVP